MAPVKCDTSTDNDAATASTKTNGTLAQADATSRAFATKSAGATNRALRNYTPRC